MPLPVRNIVSGLTLSVALAACSGGSSGPAVTDQDPATYTGSGVLSQGRATTVNEGLVQCGGGSRVSAVGEITDLAGTKWTVPSATAISEGTKATDLYNECGGVTLAKLADLDPESVPVVEIDADGEVITGYIFGDNYFELYVNGKLVGLDAVPFTPFNSNVVRYKVKKPYNIVVKVVDWEENLGLGSEDNRGSAFHPGDGGFIASFSDGTLTDESWLAQNFYTSPIYDLSCLTEEGTSRLSASCSTDGTDDGENAYAVHWALPENWQSIAEAPDWPAATTYTEETIGVDNKASYTNFAEVFGDGGAQFVWSSNVVLDNEVLLYKKVE